VYVKLISNKRLSEKQTLLTLHKT